jgi:hypothetical protein
LLPTVKLGCGRGWVQGVSHSVDKSQNHEKRYAFGSKEEKGKKRRGRNNKTAAISSWQVVIDVNDSHIDNSWNGAIQPGGTQSFGFCASKTGANYYPEVISASGE